MKSRVNKRAVCRRSAHHLLRLTRRRGQIMIHRIPGTPEAALARTLAGPTMSTTKRSLRGLALACLLLAGVAGPSLAASDEKASPRPDPAVSRTAAAGPATAAAGAVTSNPVVLQRRRQAIAQMLEGSLVYRTLFDVKLINAKLAGPFPHKVRNALFSSETHIETLYCAKAEFVFVGIQSPSRVALIRVGQSSNGSERLYAQIPNYFPPQCGNANYGPFPELELARTRRRHALGKSD